MVSLTSTLCSEIQILIFLYPQHVVTHFKSCHKHPKILTLIKWKLFAKCVFEYFNIVTDAIRQAMTGYWFQFLKKKSDSHRCVVLIPSMGRLQGNDYFGTGLRILASFPKYNWLHLFSYLLFMLKINLLPPWFAKWLLTDYYHSTVSHLWEIVHRCVDDHEHCHH